MKATKETVIPQEELKTHISRAVLIAPDINPKTGQKYTQEVIFTLRPGWSNVGKYEVALPGGKIELAKGDFKDIIEKDLQKDPHLVLTMEQIILAGLKAAERQVLEELGFTLALSLLKFVDSTTNKAGWTTYSYVAELPEKPTLVVKPNSAGTRWMGVQKIMEGKPRMLSGHLGIARKAIKQARLAKNY